MMLYKDFTFETKDRYGRYESCSVFYKGKYVALPTEDGKKRYIAQFGNQIYSECHKALSAKKSQDMVKKAI